MRPEDLVLSKKKRKLNEPFTEKRGIIEHR